MWVELVLLLLLLVLYLIWMDRKPANMPPGPFEIPFVGGGLVLEHEKALALQKKYGDIVTVRTGSFRYVILYDYKLIKEVMNRPEFIDRPPLFSSFSLDDQKTGGVTLSNGVQWQHDRRFLLRNLRNLGMGKSFLEGAINSEAEVLVEDLKRHKGEAINYPTSFSTVALNIIWQMVAGRRYDLQSKEVAAVYNATKAMYKDGEMAFLALYFPIVKRLVPAFIRRKVFCEELIENYLKSLANIIDDTIAKHEAAEPSPEKHPDLVDEYLMEMKAEQQTQDQSKLMRKGALRQMITDAFDAGSDTINYTMRWTTLLLAQNPQIAARAQQQIDEVVSRDKMVSLTDKPDLPYVEALITEVLRYSSLAVMSVDHCASQDAVIEGYHIPKNTFISFCSYAVHRNPKHWKEPEKFMPERFIGEDGKYQSPREGYVPFGIGRRQCPGEQLARMELFLFIAAILQRFDILVAEDEQIDEAKMAINMSGLRVPVDVKLIYRLRE